MSEYSVADTKNRLSELLARAEKGEEVVVTRHGKPVAKITPVRPEPKRMATTDVEWLRKHRIHPKKGTESAVQLLSRMRDEDWL